MILNMNMKLITSADDLNWKSEVLQWIWKAFPLLLTILDQAQHGRHEYKYINSPDDLNQLQPAIPIMRSPTHVNQVSFF